MDNKKKPYSICRIKKLHQRDLANAAAHNYREVNVPNADPNGQIETPIGPATANEFLQVVRNRFEEWKERKLATHNGKRGARMARDPVVCVEVLLTCTREHIFDDPSQPDRANETKLNSWKATALKFAQSHFVEVVSAILHKDERNFHYHIFCLPRGTANGDFNAKVVFSRANLIRMHDKYAEACAPLGLQRGRRGGKARHTTVKEFYTTVNKPTPKLDVSKLKAKGPLLPSKVDRLSDDKLKAYASGVFAAGAHAAEKAMKEQLTVISAKANAYDLIRDKEADLSVALDQLRHVAAQVRALPLVDVLTKIGAMRHASKADSWTMPGRAITTDGNQLFLDDGSKGRGSIDLVMKLEEVDYKQAVAWLAREFSASAVLGDTMKTARDEAIKPVGNPAPLPPPKPVPANLPKVVEYLTKQKHIAPELVQSLTQTGKLYADKFASCVVATIGDKGNGAIILPAAESAVEIHRGEADSIFVLAPANAESKEAVFVRTILDALSYRMLRPLSGWINAVAGMASKGLCELAQKLKRAGKKLVNAVGNSSNSYPLDKSLRDADPSIFIDAPSTDDWSSELALSLVPTKSDSVRPLAHPKPKLVPKFL